MKVGNEGQIRGRRKIEKKGRSREGRKANRDRAGERGIRK